MRDFQLPGRSTVHAVNGMVATSHPLAAAEALDILKAGGNAVDAAIAGAVLLGVCEPQMTGLGGDCFALVRPAGSEDVVALNGSGRAPSGLSADALRAEGLGTIHTGHPASVTVPGAVDALCRLSERYGRLGLDRSLAPAIRYFDEGVPVAPRVALDMALTADALDGAARRHYTKGGRPYGVGERFALPGQAEVLRRIARDGARAFYQGEVVEDMLAALAAAGGVHTAEDFAAAEAEWGEPVSGNYRGTELLEHPPNGQGAIAILLAHILAEFDMSGLDPNGAERLHLIAEATKLAYDMRNRLLADPGHMQDIARILDPETARLLAREIAPDRAPPNQAALAEAFHKDTVLITAVDRDGMGVSLIYSIFATFGSRIASDRFGILFHNRGSGFSLVPGHPNEAGPGKRPMHTIIPAMTRRDGRIDMVFGVMGGQFQATGHAQVLSNIVDFGMDPQEAIETPRVFPSGRVLTGMFDARIDPEVAIDALLKSPGESVLHVERGLSRETLAGLEARGHRLVERTLPWGGAQVIRFDHATGTLVGASDPRKDGIAIGY